MKMTRFILLALGTLGYLPPLQSQTPADSIITEVVVYMGSARVSRSIEVDLAAGENVLQFSGLPTDLDINQMQLGLVEGVPIRLDNLKFEPGRDREDTEEEKRLKDEIEGLRDRIGLLEADKKDEQARINFANSLSASFTEDFGEADHDMNSMMRAEEVLEFQQQISRETQAAIRKIDEKVAGLDEDLEELLEELAEETKKADQLQGEVTARIFAAEAGEVKLVFNYLVSDANWFPTYAVRVDSSDNSMEIAYQANLWQETGESWNEVAVTISTSQPNLSGNAPELQPIYLQPQRSYRERQTDAFVQEKEEVIELSVFSLEDEVSPGYLAETRIRAGMSSFSASLPARVSLASQHEPSRFPIITRGFQPQFWSEVVPLLREKGFLKTKTTNAFDLPLIQGEAQVFIDGMLTSRVTIPYTIPGDELELSLGVDDFIIVNRKETLRETQYTGLIDKTTVLKRAFTIEVQNFHSMDHQVKVFERFPISRNEKIAVKRWAPDKSQVEFEEDTGVFFWEERLTPKQSKEYKVEYDVVHPREWNLKDQI